jgi:hypothetical protein
MITYVSHNHNVFNLHNVYIDLLKGVRTMPKAPITRLELSKMIDHSLLKPTMTQEDTLQGLEVAMQEQVAAATIKPCYTKLTADVL